MTIFELFILAIANKVETDNACPNEDIIGISSSFEFWTKFKIYLSYEVNCSISYPVKAFEKVLLNNDIISSGFVFAFSFNSFELYGKK